MSKPKYDSTVARIAGNILSGRWPSVDPDKGVWIITDADVVAVGWAVAMAREIVAAVKFTEPRRESQEAPHTPQDQ